jgi:hypothetical protein
MVALLLSIFLSSLDQTIVTTALPAVVDKLGDIGVRQELLFLGHIETREYKGHEYSLVLVSNN